MRIESYNKSISANRNCNSFIFSTLFPNQTYIQTSGGEAYKRCKLSRLSVCRKRGTNNIPTIPRYSKFHNATYKLSSISRNNAELKDMCDNLYDF